MFGTVAPTQYDLRFSIFGIPVRVHPLFWLVSLFMARSRHDPKLILIWVVCVFVSILIHELGHALTAQYFGWPPHIVLYSCGGYASYNPTWGHTTGRNILILLAGPGAGFVLYGLLYGIERLLIHQGTHLSFYALVAFSDMEWINLWWGLVNLLPVHPLDGGQICRAALKHWRPFAGVDISLKISFVTAIGAGLAAYKYTGDWYPPLLFGVLAYMNFQELQGGRRW